MSSKYWENEIPTVVNTGKNVLKYFKEAGKLQVCQPNWTDDKGTTRQGKTVSLDIPALKEAPDGRAFLEQIINAIS